MCMCLTEAFLLCLNLKRIKFTRLELAAAAVSPKHTDIIHKTLKRAPQHDVIYREVEKKNMWRSSQDGGSPFHDEILEAG